MEKLKLNKKIVICNKKKNYIELNDIDHFSIRNNNYDNMDGIKINLNYYNEKIVFRLAKTINHIIKNYNIDINKYLFFIDDYNSNDIIYLNELAEIITAYNINNINERYSYIYDYMCNRLDYLFSNYNICDFKNNICCRKRCLIGKISSDILIYGCCYTKGKVCKYLDKNHCLINCLPCKFFTCSHLKKKGYNYKPRDFAIINYFFNNKQKRIIRDFLFTEKKDIINLLIKNKSRFK